MAQITHHRPATPDEASALLARPGHVPMGYGTDVLDEIESGLTRAHAVVELRRAARGVAIDAAGELRIGAAEPVGALEAHPLVRERAPALADACSAADVENAGGEGTLGGSLCRRPYCQYFRALAPCRKNGGDSCPAVDGDNRCHAILGGGPCWIVHPSRTAVALVALEARIDIASSGGARTVAAADFFVLPSVRLDHETVLAPGEWVREVVIPAASLGGWQRYRQAWGGEGRDVVSLAATRRTDGEVRLVLGGVAPVPWRVYGSIEEDAKVGNLAEDDVETLAERALYDAEPLAHNGYKVPMATALLREAIRDMWA
jgi:xanthine dehydrogenase YagS FAD-binding subunit